MHRIPYFNVKPLIIDIQNTKLDENKICLLLTACPSDNFISNFKRQVKQNPEFKDITVSIFGKKVFFENLDADSYDYYHEKIINIFDTCNDNEINDSSNIMKEVDDKEYIMYLNRKYFSSNEY